MEVGVRRCDDPRAMAGSDLTRVGLCAECRWSRRVVSGKGSVFWMCERSKVDPRFRKYPPLPVLACAGFEGGRVWEEKSTTCDRQNCGNSLVFCLTGVLRYASG